MMGSVLQVLGFALLVVWAGVVFGWPASVLAAGLVLLLLSMAVDDELRLAVRSLAARRRARRERRAALEQGIV